MRIECVGGPNDGQILSVKEDLVELLVPIPETEWLIEAPYSGVKVGSYRPITQADHLLRRWTWKPLT